MPKSCEAVFCTAHNYQEGGRLSFYKFPSRKRSPERRDRWINSVKKVNRDGSVWSPSKHLVLCSKHFVTGKPSKDPTHPDYVPSQFLHKPNSEATGKRNLKRYERREDLKRRRLIKEFHCPGSSSGEPCGEHESFGKQLLKAGASPAEQLQTDGTSEPILTIEETTPSCSDQDCVNCKARDMEINMLREERDSARKNAAQLNQQVNSFRLSASSIKDNSKRSKFLTGLSYSVFMKTFTFLMSLVPQVAHKTSMPYIDQFFITLVKLRLDLPFEFLACQTGYAESTLRGYFWKWVDIFYCKLGSVVIRWPDRDAITATLPGQFKQHFPRLTCIIDCFEIFIEQPKNLHARARTWSNYKKHNTVKFLIACTPLGAVSFLSKAWGGRVSDVELVRSSGFINRKYHLPGDQILADRGFTLQDDFAAHCSAELIIPAFTRGKSQLSAQDVETTWQLAAIRIHVERVIGLLKNRFRILQGTLPITMIKSLKDEVDEDCELSAIDRILGCCAILVNLGDGIIC